LPNGYCLGVEENAIAYKNVNSGIIGVSKIARIFYRAQAPPGAAASPPQGDQSARQKPFYT
jgi:hypothetical protein